MIIQSNLNIWEKQKENRHIFRARSGRRFFTDGRSKGTQQKINGGSSCAKRARNWARTKTFLIIARIYCFNLF